MLSEKSHQIDQSQRMMQKTIASLPHSANLLLIILLVSEVSLTAITVVPYLICHRFISWYDLLAYLAKSLCVSRFYMTCLLIFMKNDSKRKPVDDRLQELGIWFIVLGLFSSYIVTLIYLVKIVVDIVKMKVEKQQ